MSNIIVGENMLRSVALLPAINYQDQAFQLSFAHCQCPSLIPTTQNESVGIVLLTQAFRKMLKEYPRVLKEPFEGHSLAAFLRKGVRADKTRRRNSIRIKIKGPS